MLSPVGSLDDDSSVLVDHFNLDDSVMDEATPVKTSEPVDSGKRKIDTDVDDQDQDSESATDDDDGVPTDFSSTSSDELPADWPKELNKSVPNADDDIKYDDEYVDTEYDDEYVDTDDVGYFSPDGNDQPREPQLLTDKHRSVDHSFPVNTGPMLQVIYVAISKTDGSHLPDSAQIYGNITVNDYKRETFCFFQRDIRKPQMVKPRGGCYHLRLMRYPMAPVLGGKLNFRLNNKDGNAQLFNQEYDICDALENAHEKTFTLEKDGNFGYSFKMMFAKIQNAAIAKVSMGVYNPDTKDTFYHVHGKVTAQNVVCFQVDQNEAEPAGKMRHGVHAGLRQLRYHVAVPMDSPLTIDVKLYTGDRKITDRIYELSTNPHTVDDEDDYTFRCKIQGYKFFINVEWSSQQDFLLSLPTTPCLPSPTSVTVPVGGPSKDLLEVFSVHFGGGNLLASSHPDLDGTIVLLVGCRPYKEFYIFDTRNGNPDKFAPSQNEEQQFRTLSLALPNDRWLIGEDFRIYVNLKDDKGDQVCNGYINWSPYLDSGFGRRLCDVIEGEKGYFAAVHYSVFRNAKKTKVSIHCSNGPYSIYGSVFAQYDNHDYPSTYDQQCYRSVVFMRSKENPMVVESCSEVTLLKSHVSAPSACKELIVPVDLWICPCGDSSPKRFHFRASTAGVESHDIGWGVLTVTVKWCT